ncbi:MAG: hypothetical protein ACI31G_00095 [Bacilli bacterium]
MKINKFITLSLFSLLSLSIFNINYINNYNNISPVKAEEEYKIEITTLSSYSYYVNEDINFDVSSSSSIDESYTFNWSIINVDDEIVYTSLNKSFSYRFSTEGIYDINLIINNSVNLTKQINIYNELNHTPELSFNCDENISYLLTSSKIFEIQAYIDEVIDDDYIYNWVIEDHDIISFSSFTNESSLVLNPLKEGKTKLILNASKPNLGDIKSKSINITVIKEIKTIDALPTSNYLTPGSDLLIDFTINTIPHVVNYDFNYEIYFNNEIFTDYTKILNYSLLIKNVQEGKYKIKIESISSFKTVNITVDKYQFRAVFNMILPYLLSILIIVLTILIYVKTKKKKALTIKECVELLSTLENKYYLDKANNKINEKSLYLSFKKLYKLVSSLKLEANRFVMNISADAFNIVSLCEDSLSFLHKIKMKDFKKLSLIDKMAIFDLVFEKQIDEIIKTSNLFLKNYEEYQSYRDDENKKDISQDKLPLIKLEFKNRNDYLEYILELAKQKKEKDDAIDK